MGKLKNGTGRMRTGPGNYQSSSLDRDLPAFKVTLIIIRKRRLHFFRLDFLKYFRLSWKIGLKKNLIESSVYWSEVEILKLLENSSRRRMIKWLIFSSENNDQVAHQYFYSPLAQLLLSRLFIFIDYRLWYRGKL